MGWGLTPVLYRTELAPEYVDDESRTILWDPKCKGQVAAFDSLVDGIVIAGIGAGPDNPFAIPPRKLSTRFAPFSRT